MMTGRRLGATLLVAALAAPAGAQEAGAASETPRNVIVMIADGSGYNMLASTRYWLGHALTADGPDWRHLSMATYALRLEEQPRGLKQDSALVYDSVKSWNTAPMDGNSGCKAEYPAGFAGYEWNRCTAPDSAGTASAMMTGTRTYNGAINVDGNAQPVESVAEAAKASGRKVGTLSTVPFSHATPAAAGAAHNASRGNYHEIASEMLSSQTLDFIGGGGNPGYDGAGEARAAAAADDDAYHWISQADWQAVKDGTSGWTLVEDRAAIQALAASPQEGRVLVMPQIAATMQVERPGPAGTDLKTSAPLDTPRLETVPTLPELAMAGLSQLQNPDGLFLMIEGGAVDWGMHANMLGRAIEEYDDFDRAVQAVSDWIEDPATPASWQDTLVIVTADHDHMLTGPDRSEAFDPIENRGAGKLPGHMWWSNSHSNQLVPFFVRGAGAERFVAAADQTDRAVSGGRTYGRGAYLTQPEMGRILKQMMAGRK